MRFRLWALAAVAIPLALYARHARCEEKAAKDFGAGYRALTEEKTGQAEPERLKKLFELYWEYRMMEYPEAATYAGYPGQNDRWTDDSLEAIARRERELQWPIKAIESIDRAKLGAADQLSYDLFKRNAKLAIEGTAFKGELMPINQMGGVQQDVAQTLSIMPAAKVKDYEDILARLRGVPKLIDQAIALMDKGLEAGITPPRVTLRDVPQQVLNQITDDPAESAILRPFGKFPAEIGPSDQERLRKEATEAYKGGVIPAYRKLHEYLTEKYIPKTRESIACSELPNGKAWYAYAAKTSTTTDLTPQQIHEIGLSEVKRIRGEMDKVIARSGFKGSFEEFTNFLRTDPQFFFTDARQLVVEYRDIAKRIDPELPRLFGRLPRMPYGVKVIPTYAEKSQTTAYYMGGSPEAGRAGYFYCNTYDLKSRPKWEMEALTVHEAAPGHHIQISLAQEMEGLPEFRKHSGPTAFVEGWGLYSESLGEEIGLYQDPYSKFGQLTYEMWRAVRLVVDTGMHSLGWSREQAIEFFKKNSGRAEHDIVVEVDRYIVWPGQALAYKIGQLKMKELRAYATKELGDKFDVREFHDRLLENGAVPMDVLESQIKGWVEKKKRS